MPETPPTQVSCVPLSSQSVKVSWSAPPPHQHGGIIQGYKVYYRPVPTDNSKSIWRKKVMGNFENREIGGYLCFSGHIDGGRSEEDFQRGDLFTHFV